MFDKIEAKMTTAANLYAGVDLEWDRELDLRDERVKSLNSITVFSLEQYDPQEWNIKELNDSLIYKWVFDNSARMKLMRDELSPYSHLRITPHPTRPLVVMEDATIEHEGEKINLLESNLRAYILTMIVKPSKESEKA